MKLTPETLATITKYKVASDTLAAKEAAEALIAKEKENNRLKRECATKIREYEKHLKIAEDKIDRSLVRLALQGYQRYEPEIYSDLCDSIQSTLIKRGFDVERSREKHTPLVKAILHTKKLIDFFSNNFRGYDDEHTRILFKGASCVELIDQLNQFANIDHIPPKGLFEKLIKTISIVKDNYIEKVETNGVAYTYDSSFTLDENGEGELEYDQILDDLLRSIDLAKTFISELEGTTEKQRKAFISFSYLYIHWRAYSSYNPHSEFFPSAGFIGWASNEGQQFFDEVQYHLERHAAQGNSVATFEFYSSKDNGPSKVMLNNVELGKIYGGAAIFSKALNLLGFKVELQSLEGRQLCNVAWL